MALMYEVCPRGLEMNIVKEHISDLHIDVLVLSIKNVNNHWGFIIFWHILGFIHRIDCAAPYTIVLKLDAVKDYLSLMCSLVV